MSITLDETKHTTAIPQALANGRTLETLDFTLPPELEASEPPEARGLPRDSVRLMVSHCGGTSIAHTRFGEIGEFLQEGDLLVVNTSGTLNAAIDATREDGSLLELHLSTHLPGDIWTIELRLPSERGTKPFCCASAGETLRLPAGGEVHLLAPYATDRSTPLSVSTRLWLSTLRLPMSLENYLAEYGFPIRYSYVPRRWPSEHYQTVFVTEMGSAEMPSAGRAFTPELVTRLTAQGVRFAPLLLHTGVASMENHEPPYEEYYRVPLTTAHTVNEARASGRRVIAVGTTVVRALETVTDESGTAHPGDGWTSLVITLERGVRVVDGLLTGLHEPRASHLAMLEAICGRKHLRLAYAEALRERYLWHEFGDLHLLLP